MEIASEKKNPLLCLCCGAQPNYEQDIMFYCLKFAQKQLVRMAACLTTSIAFASSDTPVPPPLMGPVDWSIIEHLGFSLLILVSLLFLLRFFILRWQPARYRELLIRIVGGVPIGAKERIVAVDIENKRFYLGVAPGKIIVIHETKKPSDAPPSPSSESYFRSLLKKEKESCPE